MRKSAGNNFRKVVPTACAEAFAEAPGCGRSFCFGRITPKTRNRNPFRGSAAEVPFMKASAEEPAEAQRRKSLRICGRSTEARGWKRPCFNWTHIPLFEPLVEGMPESEDAQKAPQGPILKKLREIINQNDRLNAKAIRGC